MTHIEYNTMLFNRFSAVFFVVMFTLLVIGHIKMAKEDLGKIRNKKRG